MSSPNVIISEAFRLPHGKRFIECKTNVNRNIVLGQKGRHIARLQEVLNVAGFERSVQDHFRRPGDLITPEDPEWVKAVLRVHGWYPLATDGSFGHATARAVAGFKRLYMIPVPNPGQPWEVVNGKVGQLTIERLDVCAWEFENDHTTHGWLAG